MLDHLLDTDGHKCEGTPEMERTKMELLFPRRFKNLIRFNYEKFGRWEGGPRRRGYMCTCS